MSLKRILIAVLVIAVVALAIIGVVKLAEKPDVKPQVNDPVSVEPAVNVNELINQEIHKNLPQGAEIYVNSGLSWDINVPKSRLSEAETIAKEYMREDFTVESFEERMILDTDKFLDKDLKVIMYDVDDNGTHYYFTYVFDANSAELLSHNATPSLDGIKKVRSFIIKLDEAGF